MQTNISIFDTQVGYNIDTLEGAIMHILQIFGCLSVESLDRFARIYAAKRGKTLKSNTDISKWLLPQMRKSKKIFQLGGERYYTISPQIKPSRSTQDAFWVFLEYAEEVELQTVGQGPDPAQVTFFRNGRDYHIIAVKDNGERELRKALIYEENMANMRRAYSAKDGAAHQKKYPEERFIVLFRTDEDMLGAAYNLHGRTMYCVVSYPEGKNQPEIRCYEPEKPNVENSD